MCYMFWASLFVLVSCIPLFHYMSCVFFVFLLIFLFSCIRLCWYFIVSSLLLLVILFKARPVGRACFGWLVFWHFCNVLFEYSWIFIGGGIVVYGIVYLLV